MVSYDIFKDLSIILIFAKLFGILARKCRAPQVVGEIIEGLLIGPSVLGRDGKAYKLDDNAVMTKYGPSMKMWGRIPDALAGAMANQMYVCNFDTDEEVQAFFYDLMQSN